MYRRKSIVRDVIAKESLVQVDSPTLGDYSHEDILHEKEMLNTQFNDNVSLGHDIVEAANELEGIAESVSTIEGIIANDPNYVPEALVLEGLRRDVLRLNNRFGLGISNRVALEAIGDDSATPTKVVADIKEFVSSATEELYAGANKYVSGVGGFLRGIFTSAGRMNKSITEFTKSSDRAKYDARAGKTFKASGYLRSNIPSETDRITSSETVAAFASINKPKEVLDDVVKNSLNAFERVVAADTEKKLVEAIKQNNKDVANSPFKKGAFGTRRDTLLGGVWVELSPKVIGRYGNHEFSSVVVDYYRRPLQILKEIEYPSFDDMLAIAKMGQDFYIESKFIHAGTLKLFSDTNVLSMGSAASDAIDDMVDAGTSKEEIAREALASIRTIREYSLQAGATAMTFSTFYNDSIEIAYRYLVATKP